MTLRAGLASGAVVMACVAAVTLTGCRGGSGAAAASARVAPREQDAKRDGSMKEPSWTSAFGRVDALFVWKPRKLKRDAVFGPLAVAMTSRAVAMSGADLGAIEEVAAESDEVYVGVRGATGESVAVLRGVPADRDPERMKGAGGDPVFHAAPELPGLAEFAAPKKATLFVFATRTWVLVPEGDAPRLRTRFRLRRPGPTLPIDERALAVVFLDGAALRHAIPALGEGRMAELGEELVEATLVLSESAPRVRIELLYKTEADARRTHRLVVELRDALLPKTEGDLRKILSEGTSTLSEKTVTFSCDVTAALLAKLALLAGALSAPRSEAPGAPSAPDGAGRSGGVQWHPPPPPR